MGTKKISELPASTDLYDGCCFPVVTNGETRKVTYEVLKERLNEDLVGDGNTTYEFSILGNILTITPSEGDPIQLTLQNPSGSVNPTNYYTKNQSDERYVLKEESGNGFTQSQLTNLCNALKGAKFESEEASLSAKSFVESVLGESDTPTQPDVPEDPTVTLSSISAIYNGGEVVEGTNASDLQGIVVTGHYSDGSTKTVNGWSISGTVAVGSNTFTITYGSKSTTITVVGLAKQAGETVELNWRLVNTTGAGGKELNKEVNKGFYSDGGNTSYSDARFPDTNIVFGLTDVVDNDTNVKITCSPSKSVFQCFVFGCTQSRGTLIDSVGNNQLEEPLYHIKSSSETFAYGWSTATHEWNYTIKAGYSLCVVSILSALGALEAVTVEVV